eukprot:4991058-Amphidinium_carterae.1
MSVSKCQSMLDAIATGARVCADYNMPDKLGPMFEGVNWVRMDDRARFSVGGAAGFEFAWEC